MANQNLTALLYNNLLEALTGKNSGEDNPLKSDSTLIQFAQTAVSKRFLSNIKSPDQPKGSPAAAEAFSRLVDNVPKFQDTWVAGAGNFSTKYRSLVDGINVADTHNEPSEEYKKAYAILFKTVLATDDEPEEGIELTRAHKDYNTAKQTLQTAINGYNADYITYQKALDDLSAKKRRMAEEQWQIDQAKRTEAIQMAKNTLLGYKKVETALEVIENQGNSALRQIVGTAKKMVRTTKGAIGFLPVYPSINLPNWPSHDEEKTIIPLTPELDKDEKPVLDKDKKPIMVAGDPITVMMTVDDMSDEDYWGQFDFNKVEINSSDVVKKDYHGKSKFDVDINGLTWSKIKIGSQTAVDKSYDIDLGHDDNITIGFEYLNVAIVRPWYLEGIFRIDGWEHDIPNIISNGKADKANETNYLPGYVTSVIVAKNIKITGLFNSTTKKVIEQVIETDNTFRWGPFKFGAVITDNSKREETRTTIDNKTIEMKGLQIIGYITTAVPECDNRKKEKKA